MTPLESTDNHRQISKLPRLSPEAVADLGAGARSSNHFLRWAFLLQRTRLKPALCRDLLRRHGLYPTSPFKH